MANLPGFSPLAPAFPSIVYRLSRARHLRLALWPTCRAFHLWHQLSRLSPIAYREPSDARRAGGYPKKGSAYFEARYGVLRGEVRRTSL